MPGAAKSGLDDRENRVILVSQVGIELKNRSALCGNAYAQSSFEYRENDQRCANLIQAKA